MHGFQVDLLEMEATLDFQERWCVHRGSPATLPERAESAGCPGVPLCEEGLTRAEAVLSTAAGAIHPTPSEHLCTVLCAVKTAGRSLVGIQAKANWMKGRGEAEHWVCK